MVVAAVLIIRRYCFPVNQATYRYSVLRGMEEQGSAGTEGDQGSHTAGEDSDEVRYDDTYRRELNMNEGFGSSKSKCGVSKACPPGHYVFRIRSGAANTVGPKICFEGKTIMSTVQNNVGGGLDIVVVNGKSGVVENARILNGSPQETLSFLNNIKPGMIVLVASFDNANGMTNEIRNIFSGMGSSKARSIKFRDNWAFAVRTGLESTLHFEKITVTDEQTNLYEGWPETAEVEGCFSSIVGQANLGEV
ncbi:protein FAM3D [Limanda limanda]|uniref:protein FAM3D n=1 Tax=Limanda limanda TaxID=27771 RepID=UPI0029C8DB74|nr:protein FAM3D [Limanda limanda]